MKIEDSLKHLKRIEADPTYMDYSRRAILASAPLERLTVRTVLMRVFEGAGSVALVGLLIFAIAGGFSDSKYLSPVQFSGIDPAALHAEAQAIDMQINLANLTYTESDNVAAAETTPHLMVMAVQTTTAQSAINATGTVGAAAATSTTSMAAATSTAIATTPTSSISINEALQTLTE